MASEYVAVPVAPTSSEFAPGQGTLHQDYNKPPPPVAILASPAGLARNADPTRCPTSCARKAGVRQCWAAALVVKGLLLTAGFLFCGIQVYTVWLRSVFIAGAIISFVQAVLGVYATVMVCYRPQHSVKNDYIVWTILTLCEVPGFIVGWGIAIVNCINMAYLLSEYGKFDRGLFAISMVSITLPTTFLTVTAILAHSFRPRSEGGQRMALISAT